MNTFFIQGTNIQLIPVQQPNVCLVPITTVQNQQPSHIIQQPVIIGNQSAINNMNITPNTVNNMNNPNMMNNMNITPNAVHNSNRMNNMSIGRNNSQSLTLEQLQIISSIQSRHQLQIPITSTVQPQRPQYSLVIPQNTGNIPQNQQQQSLSPQTPQTPLSNINNTSTFNFNNFNLNDNMKNQNQINYAVGTNNPYHQIGSMQDNKTKRIREIINLLGYIFILYCFLVFPLYILFTLKSYFEYIFSFNTFSTFQFSICLHQTLCKEEESHLI